MIAVVQDDAWTPYDFFESLFEYVLNLVLTL